MKEVLAACDIENLINKQDFTSLHKVITGMSFGNLVNLFSTIDDELLSKIVNLFPVLLDPSLLLYLPRERRDLVFLLLTDENLNKILQHNDEDEILKILEMLSAKGRRHVMCFVPEGFLGAFRIKSKYSEDKVGWYMSLSYVTLPSFWTCSEALKFIIKSVEKNTIRNKHFSRIYVVNPREQPIGYVTLSELMACSDKDAKIDTITNKEIQIIKAYDDAKEIAHTFSLFRCAFMIVVDKFSRMVGVINYQQAINIIEEKASENVLDIGGVGESYNRSFSFFSICFDRVRWLAIALINSIISSIVISNFQMVIEKKIALAIIMPIIASLGGNVGIQTLSVVLRHISHEVPCSQLIIKEVTINCLNGIIIGAVSSLIVGIVFHSFLLSIVVASAMFFNMIWSSFIGATMPIIISRMGFDETISSGPIISSINDVFGFAIFLGIASIVFG